MNRLERWLSQEHWLVGASLTRISLGLWAIYYYVVHWQERDLLWGPNGLWPFQKFLEDPRLANVFALHPSEAYFQFVYLASIVIAILVTLGYRSRLMIPIHWLMIWSYFGRNPFLPDGGDNFMRIALLFLVMVDTGAYFAIRRPPSRLYQYLRPGLTVVHNVGVLLILLQLTYLYMSTGLYKAAGELWQNGTALYYILRVDEFSWPGMAGFIYQNSYLTVAGTYATVLFEVLFVTYILNRWARYLIILAGVSFHLGTIFMMGLVSFGWGMLSIYPFLVKDDEYHAAYAWLMNLLQQLRERYALTVYYDGDCTFCTRSTSLLRTLNSLSLVQFISFREPGVVERYGLEPERVERRIQSRNGRGDDREGIEAMIEIVRRSPILFPLVPVLWVIRLAVGQQAYDFVANRRYFLGGCQGGCAVKLKEEVKS